MDASGGEWLPRAVNLYGGEEQDRERAGKASDQAGFSSEHRDVAIKIAAVEFSERSAREARLAAALNHVSICHVYDVGPNYLVMELVEGPTLSERIEHGPLPLDEALAIARQTTAGLEAAHEKGIVHRDLKPGNIKIRADDTVKVLDFGLAKAAGMAGTCDEASRPACCSLAGASACSGPQD